MKIRNFGSIRQNYSYTVGDEMLYQFSFHLSRLFSYGIPFHMYGTTFSLVLPYEESESEMQTQKLIEFLEKDIEFGEHAIKTDYILAEHVWADEGNVESIYEKLEYATEVAKENKQKFITCTLDLEAKRLRTKYLISRLETIDLESGYQVWFQPIYSTGKKCFSSMEALLRLREPNGDFISPAEFIPLAEKSGQIKDITWFVLEESCRALASTPALKDLRVSINLPMQQLLDPDFEAKLNKLVDGYGIAHEKISFEFTERVIIEDLDAAEKNMNRLAAMGYTFYLDDFGVGYSNFNCVLRLPLRTVKLDMSLTATAEKLREN
jgi:EAL domain-containing protein (putative c-di-GMP-specific phosphodiesterase class I)